MVSKRGTGKKGFPEYLAISGDFEMCIRDSPKFTPHSIADKRMMVLWLRFLTEINSCLLYTSLDVYCEVENGEKFIVEMQNAYQTYFKDRALFYSTFPVREQAPKGLSLIHI